MPSINQAEINEHTEDIQDIISAPPSWLVRWGMLLFFIVLLIVFSLSVLIRYPEIVHATLRINSLNSPKPVASKVSGKLVKLLVRENDSVAAEQPLAYLESTANHDKVLTLLINLKGFRNQIFNSAVINDMAFNQVDNIDLGELQSAYQVFFQEYLSYKSAISDGFYLRKKSFLQKDLADIVRQQEQLYAERSLQQRDLELAEAEYEMHEKLRHKKVETQAEFRRAESSYLAKKYPLVQSETSLIAANTNYTAKQKEILELDNLILEAKSKFVQALNSIISQAEDWKSSYILSASQSGKISFVGIVQEKQIFSPNQEVFYVNPGSQAFFGEMYIPQKNMGKVKIGQKVLVKLKSYPYEEYGMLTGTISYINDVPYKDSVFISKVQFNKAKYSELRKEVILKNGMLANAEIITQDASLFARMARDIIKMLQ